MFIILSNIFRGFLYILLLYIKSYTKNNKIMDIKGKNIIKMRKKVDK
ncbi:MAG: hypothetical protein Q606_CBAC00272G0002 [Intestinibacter bartlettii DORA_8_9]|jgi:hypothetical protein|nr:hypothetical protein CLOBAR_00626 [Intestinibacter bartlettii DSM 16795]ETI94725.1 MAG: hypothetical protein Q606_CBAC00272G0002 [Intestinibacter bartlettii DORA_8_9]